MKEKETGWLVDTDPGCGCGCGPDRLQTSPENVQGTRAGRNILDVELLAIDLETCERCVPTGEQLRTAVRLLRPVAEALGVVLMYRETVVRTPEEAQARALLSSPTIRVNGRDIAQDIRESECASCGDLTEKNAIIECRDWHYRGEVYPSVPLPLLIEAIMEAMLKIDDLPFFTSGPLEELPENLKRYFDNRKQVKNMPSCCC
ncbi:MAG: DUF2703 domain-containing protein [bacterium]|nr:DUF2703 domain-containing protein [bacterium]